MDSTANSRRMMCVCKALGKGGSTSVSSLNLKSKTKKFYNRHTRMVGFNVVPECCKGHLHIYGV